MGTKRFTCCPHCGGKSGFVSYSDYLHVPFFMDFDGEPQDNHEMFDDAYVIKGKNLYCQDCGKLVCRSSTAGFD